MNTLSPGSCLAKAGLVFLTAVLLFGPNLFPQDAEFENFLLQVAQTVPQGFGLNRNRSWESGLTSKAVFDRDNSRGERLCFTLHREPFAMNKIETAVITSSSRWLDREILFTYDPEAGVSRVVILLKRQAGLLVISHRIFGDTPLGLEEFRLMVTPLDLTRIERGNPPTLQ